MENIRVFEEGGYIHFILRPEELMRLRYSQQSTIAFSAFMDGWLGQMKTQVRKIRWTAIGMLSKSISGRFLMRGG
jgi:hypothetical protein